MLTLSFTACGGHDSSLPTAQPGGAAGQSIGQTTPSSPVISVPKTFGALAYTDRGRRGPNQPVRVAITLRYNHQTELDRFVAQVGNPRSGLYRHFLTQAQFNAYYAPTAGQEASVVQALQNAGFRIVQRFANRTMVDAVAPSATVERFFTTEMHTVDQGKYGERYTNVKSATVPASIAPYVLTASLSNVVIARTQIEQDGGVVHNPRIVVTTSKQHHPGNGHEVSPAMRTFASGCTGQLLLNPGFESGDVDWSDPNGDIYNYSPYAYQGNYFAWIDGYSSPVTDPGVSQTVSIPAGCTATLTYYLYVGSNEPNSPT
ncbi:MAG: hypothetical protein JO104_07015, partial [Candidatus Eremiobacteraeota bacterium]|nr:hypothetical protein [Candidatus Eremiobacteraeota bacterium]